MILTTHAIVGVAVGPFAQSIGKAFLVGVLTHYILDAIPHYEYGKGFFTEPRTISLRKFFQQTFIDGMLGFGISLAFFFPKNRIEALYFFAALIGALLPDFLNGVQKLFPNRFTEFFWHIHGIFHTDVRLDQYPRIGIISQTALCLLFIIVGVVMRYS